MELVLSRVDYAQVGTTSKRCMRLVPQPNFVAARVAIGSHSGVLLCFQRRKNDTNVVFKTLPSQKIESVTLGGALGTLQDKIFIATGNVVKGYSKKGKQFFTFETNMTEAISSMYIYGVDMFLCGTCTFSHYHDCSDTNYYLCGDRINDILCLPVTEGSWVGRGLTPVIACDDRTIKVLDGSHLGYQVEIGGAPTVLHLYMNTGGPDGHHVLYGTKDGKIGLVELPATGGYLKWEISSSNSSGCVTALHCYEFTKHTRMDLIVGKDDGLVEIYSIDDQDKLQLRHTHQCEESITGLECGRVSSPNYDEVIITTYTGWVFGLTTEPMQKEIGPNQEFRLNPEMEVKVQQLKIEIEDLQNQVGVERERYHEQTATAQAQGEEEVNTAEAQSRNQTKALGVSAVPVFAINDRFQLIKEEAAYMLAVELIVPIDYVLLQCDVLVDLLDVDKNSAVISLTQCDPNSGNALLATYRCQANTTRLDMKIRSIEGQYGTMLAYVSPKSHPKVCQVRSYPIKPLSLHQRTHDYDNTRPQNVLKLSGNFSLAEAHSWANFCLPELPDKVPPGEQATFHFVSTFTNTQLECAYSKGSAIFRSDNLSTIAILRDVLSKEATKKKIKLDISCDINDDTVPHTLQLVHPKLEYQLNLAKKVHLAEALQELSVQEGDSSFMSEEFVEILKKAEDLKTENQKQTAHMERIYGVVTDLYIDKFKFKGVNVKHKIPQLLHILDNYTLESLLAFFQS